MRRRILIAGVVVALIAVVGVVAYVMRVHHESRDIRGSSTIEFTTTTATPLVVAAAAAAVAAKEPGVAWAMYGHDPERLRVATGVSLAPPFKKDWTFHARSLVEFPPALAYGRLFFATNAGVVDAISATTGKRAWRYRSHRCQAMSPAVDGRTVYVAFLNRPPCNAGGGDGQLVALWAGSGQVRWRRTIGPSESSPVVVNGNVYVGDWNGEVYCFSEATGRRWWKFSAGAKIKGGIAVSGNRVYFGTYDSKVYALTANKGKLVWTANAQPRFGHPGEFYATPAVAYGRVYVGATDGKEYSFGAATGDLIWSHSTGGYVYSSAAVWRERVLVGSYSGSFFAFDAATGDELWSFRADGPISGSPTVIAGRVYFATLKGTTYALDARTGHLTWTFPDGEYSPVIADTKRLYLVGRARVYGLSEKRPG